MLPAQAGVILENYNNYPFERYAPRAGGGDPYLLKFPF